MATAIKKKPAASSSGVLNMDADRKYAIEQLLFELADAGGIDALESEHIGQFPDDWSIERIEHEIQRRGNIRELQRTAGDRDHQTKLAEQVDATSKALAAKSPKIQEQIAKLQSELKQLQDDAAAAEHRKRGSERAVEQLAKSIPDWFATKTDIDKRMANKRRRTWLQKESRAKSIESTLAVDIGTPEGRTSFWHHASAARRFDLIDRGRVGVVHEHAVPGYMQALKAELAKLKPTIEDGQAEYQAAVEAVEQRRRAFYTEVFEPPVSS